MILFNSVLFHLSSNMLPLNYWKRKWETICKQRLEEHDDDDDDDDNNNDDDDDDSRSTRPVSPSS